MLLNLNGAIVFVAGEAYSKAQSLLLATKEFCLDELGCKFIVKNIILMNQVHHLFSFFLLLLDQLLSPMLKVKIIIFDKCLLV